MTFTQIVWSHMQRTPAMAPALVCACQRTPRHACSHCLSVQRRHTPRLVAVAGACTWDCCRMPVPSTGWGGALGGGGHARDAAVAEPARQEVKPEVADGLGQVGVLQAPACRADAKLSSPGLYTGSRHSAGSPALLLASGAQTRSRRRAGSLVCLVASGACQVTNNRLVKGISVWSVGVLQAHQSPA